MLKQCSWQRCYCMGCNAVARQGLFQGIIYSISSESAAQFSFLTSLVAHETLVRFNVDIITFWGGTWQLRQNIGHRCLCTWQLFSNDNFRFIIINYVLVAPSAHFTSRSDSYSTRFGGKTSLSYWMASVTSVCHHSLELLWHHGITKTFLLWLTRR